MRKYAASSAVLWVWVEVASLLTTARLVSARSSAAIASFRRSLAAVLHSVKDWPIGLLSHGWILRSDWSINGHLAAVPR